MNYIDNSFQVTSRNEYPLLIRMLFEKVMERGGRIEIITEDLSWLQEQVEQVGVIAVQQSVEDEKKEEEEEKKEERGKIGG